MARPKLDLQQIAPQVSPQMLVGLLDLAGEFGVAPERLCAGLALDIEDLRRGEQLSDRQAWRIIRRALQLTGRPDLGLELGRRENLSHFGLPGFAMSTARNYGEAAEIAVRYQAQTGAVTNVTLEEDGDCLALVISSRMHDASMLPFLIEEVCASVLAISRILIGDHFRPHAVELAYPAPAYAERYGELFASPVHFGLARNRFLVARHWLQSPISTHSAAMSSQLRTLLDQGANAKDALSHPMTAVEQALQRSGNATLSIEQVARSLELSVRTLRRRLSEAGTSFRAISDRVHAEAARRLLCEEGMTVAATSKQLGFSDSRAFRRAFKRWLGLLPGEIRRN
ncbi:MAG: AraC family transcriptional regulator [Proteobacteria bacterium]|nr:AraC family transcriptional regulator [Pseudomonadota bacterium]